uniref:Transposase (Putative), gypsy type n=1 Tax=Tanacetum cinerariifolium TaxID=118510 RepID=A0A6L2NIG9_TANCI|nr:transposase (putative), gypsy type [Tanacetum cinerariifolium]
MMGRLGPEPFHLPHNHNHPKRKWRIRVNHLMRHNCRGLTINRASDHCFTSEYGIPESLHPELPGPEEPIVEFSEGKVGVYTKFFEFANYHIPISQFLFDILGHYQIHLSQLYDLFSLINALNPTKVKIGTRPRVAHEVPLLTATASRVIDIEDTAVASGSSGTPSALENSPLNFANEDSPQMITERAGQNNSRTNWAKDEAEANAPPKVVRKDHAAFRLAQSTLGGKSLAPMGLDAGSTVSTPATQDAPTAVSDPDLLSYAKPQPHSELDIAQSFWKTTTEIPSGNVPTMKVQGLFSAESPEPGKSSSFLFGDGSPGGIYQPGWGVTNNCCLDIPDACQDMVDHIVPSGLLKKTKAKIVRRDQRIQVMEEEVKRLDQEIKALKVVEVEVHGLRNQTKNLETLLEAEVDMKKAAEAKNAKLAKELESHRVQFSDLQVSNIQQVFDLQAQVTDEEKIKAAFEEFKRYEDDRVEHRYAEMDARLDKLSVDFDKELYPHMLTAISGRRWVIRHGMRLAVMKCAKSTELRKAFADVVSAGLVKGMSEGLKHGIEHGRVGRDLATIEAYDPEADSKYVKALQDLKDLRCRTEKKKCRVVCSTHGVSFAHHARSYGILVSVPTVAPKGLAILLADDATQTEVADKEDEPSPRLQRSISLPPFF